MRLIGLVLALSLLLAPIIAEAQQTPGKIPRVALFSIDLAPERITAFRESLRRLGYVEGQNIAIELRSAEGRSERLPSLATGLIELKIDVIVAAGAEAIRASQQATQMIPIVMVLGGNPVMSGFVAGLPRPGGNITGLAATIEGLSAKRLELIKETLPQVARVGVLCHSTNPSHALFFKEIEDAAPSLGVQPYASKVRTPAELEGAVSAMAKAGVGAVLVLGDNMFEVERSRIVHLLAMRKLPTIHFARLFVEAGGLMSYAPEQNDVYRRAATFVERILKGAKPSDLPVEQPTKFELVINLKTATALGLTIPQSLLVRADEIIR